MGEPVDIPRNLQSEAKKLYSKHQLNIVASDLVSLNRRLPDVRHESCLIGEKKKKMCALKRYDQFALYILAVFREGKCGIKWCTKIVNKIIFIVTAKFL